MITRLTRREVINLPFRSAIRSTTNGKEKLSSTKKSIV